jgi:hypothetical protein
MGDWGVLSGRSGDENRPFGNALFAAALAAVAVGAFLLQRQYSAYNSSRSRAISSAAPAAAFVRDESEPHDHFRNGNHPYDVQHLRQVDETPEGIHDKPIGEWSNDQTETTSKEGRLYDDYMETQQVPKAASNGARKPTWAASADEELPSPAKYPIRTSEGAVALQRMREIQKRRRELYDRAIQRRESSIPLSHHARQETRKAADALSTTPNHAAVDEDEPRMTSKSIQSSRVNGEMDWEAFLEEESEPIELTVGMSTEALRERARAASKASAESAAAARRAAAASSMAADAADRAINAARNAAIAAARCQSALDLRAADAIEEAYHAATEAEAIAQSAAQRAAVGAAKAVMDEHDAERSASVASKAGELSSPHGPSEVMSSWWRQGRRQVGKAVGSVQQGFDVAQGGLQGWMEGAKEACVQGVAKMKRMAGKSTPPGSSGENNE